VNSGWESDRDRQFEFVGKAVGTDKSSSKNPLLRASTSERWHPKVGFAIRGYAGRDDFVLAVQAEKASGSTGNASSLVTQKSVETPKPWGQTTRAIRGDRQPKLFHQVTHTERGNDFKR
jgi:hypothetical protein